MSLMLKILLLSLFIAAPEPPSSTQPTLNAHFDFSGLLNIWEQIRKNSKEFQVNLDRTKNGIHSLSIFCSKDDALEFKGFWIITRQDFKECYIFVDTEPNRIEYKNFLEIIGITHSWKELTLANFERQLELRPEDQKIKVAVTEEEKAKLRKRALILENLKRFVKDNNNPQRIAKTDVEIVKEETDRKIKEFQRTLELLEKSKP
jgi:hypothetical protein